MRTPQASEAGPVQPAGVRQAVRVSFNLPASPSTVDPDEEEEARDLVVSTPAVQDKTLICLVNFIYDKHPESHLLSSPPLGPSWGFESFCAVSDPQ